MKYIKLYESIKDIHNICEEYGIRNYTINSDGSIDVNSGVSLYDIGLTKLPLKFNKVSGSFICGSNKLTTLEGSPKWVGFDFNCGSNKLTSLEGCPEYVGGDFYCTFNDIISFEGFPKHVGEFYCQGNPIAEIWNLFLDKSKIEFFNDCDIIQDVVVILDRLNFFLEEIGKKPVKAVKGYYCI